jgi:hypothetical protein
MSLVGDMRLMPCREVKKPGGNGANSSCGDWMAEENIVSKNTRAVYREVQACTDRLNDQINSIFASTVIGGRIFKGPDAI